MILKKLTEKHEEKASIDHFIEKGGKTKHDNQDSEENIARFSLRIPETLVLRIDQKRKDNFGVSRNLWIIEAIKKALKETD